METNENFENEQGVDSVEQVPSLEELVPSLEELFLEAEEARQNAHLAQINYEKALSSIAYLYDNTFCYDGQWYQIRSRDSAAENRRITYLCSLRDKPSTWLTGRKKKVKTEEAVVDSEPTVFAAANMDATDSTTVLD